MKSGMGPLARYSNHQEIVNRRPEQMYTSFDTRLEWPREGSLFELELNKRWDPKWGHYSSQLLGHYESQAYWPVDRCGTCQETISRRLEHMSTPWLREGPLYKSVSNKCKGVQTVASIQVISGPLLNSGLRRLFRYGTHQAINGKLELVHLPSYLILEWPEEGPLFQLELKKMQGPICDHYSSHPLGHYLCQVWDPWPGKSPV